MGYDEMISRLVSRIDNLKTEIQTNLEANKETASGRTSESIRVITMCDGIALVAGPVGEVAPIASLEVGQEPSVVPIGTLRQWAMDKGKRYGLWNTDEATINRIAWGAQRNIAKGGTKRYQEHTDVYSSACQACALDCEDIVCDFIGYAISSAFESNF